MAGRDLTYETDGVTVSDVQIDGKPIAEASHTDLVELVYGLIAHSMAIRRRLVSPGQERRAWREKLPEDRKPGAPLHDLGGVR